MTGEEATKLFYEACKEAGIPVAEDVEDDTVYDENGLEVGARVYFTGRRKDIKQKDDFFHKIHKWFNKDGKKSE